MGGSIDWRAGMGVGSALNEVVREDLCKEMTFELRLNDGG